MTDPPVPRVTLMDVAQRAGVSRTTASFVTTGRLDMRISADAQERVLRAARELGYRPSLLARSLRTNRSQTIGLLSDQIAVGAFAGEMIRGSLTSALLHEHLLFVAETAGSAAVEKRMIDNMLDRGVGGFLYACMYTKRVRISSALRAQPLVLVNCTTRARTAPTVIPNESEAGRAVARILLRYGHSDRIVLSARHRRTSSRRPSGWPASSTCWRNRVWSSPAPSPPGGGPGRPTTRSATSSARAIGRPRSSA